jgi:uncharacterized FAD-dependent dehydrogenase
LERGKAVEERQKDVKALQEKGLFDPESNMCYGEGGAGTFSDGKLNTGVRDSRIDFVLQEFVAHGAKDDILTDALPHIGSDYLQKIVKPSAKKSSISAARFALNLNSPMSKSNAARSQALLTLTMTGRPQKSPAKISCWP